MCKIENVVTFRIRSSGDQAALFITGPEQQKRKGLDTTENPNLDSSRFVTTWPPMALT
jgi:hypothetical protein